jgi:hypothetical protein
MGVKHTVEMTRQEAEWKICQMLWRERAYLFIKRSMVGASDDDICRILETLNDSYHDGEGFENYRIVR